MQLSRNRALVALFETSEFWTVVGGDIGEGEEEGEGEKVLIVLCLYAFVFLQKVLTENEHSPSMCLSASTVILMPSPPKRTEKMIMNNLKKILHYTRF